MNETYAGDGKVQAKGVGVVLAVVSLLATATVVSGLIYATGIGGRRQALLAAGGCAPVPSLSQTGLDCTTEQQLASEYTKMTTPAIQQLNTDVTAYTANQFHSLAACKAALTSEIAWANSLDASLAQFPFPAAIGPQVRKLIRANDALAGLTAEQARSSSLRQLRSFDERVQIASAAVQADVQFVGKALAKPPTADQEP